MVRDGLSSFTHISAVMNHNHYHYTHYVTQGSPLITIYIWEKDRLLLANRLLETTTGLRSFDQAGPQPPNNYSNQWFNQTLQRY